MQQLVGPFVWMRGKPSRARGFAMFVIKSVGDLFEGYASLGGEPEEVPHGVLYRFAGQGDDSAIEGTMEFHGDPSLFCLATVDCAVLKDFVSRTQFRERYIGLSFNDVGSVEAYRKRDEARTLDEGLHFYVATTSTPLFMRIAAGTRLRFTALYFMERFFKENAVALPEGFWPACERVLNAGEQHVSGLGVVCRQIAGCSLGSEEAYRAYLRGQGLAAAGLIIDHVARCGAAPARAAGAELQEVVARAKAVLKSEYVHPPTVLALAKRLGTNKNRLQDGFAALEGMSVSAYLRAVRMERALDLLTETELPVEEIAVQVGYMGKNNFYKAFRGTYGHTPNAIRAFMRQAC